ncbi:MAG: hypothetical protein PUE18_09200, partial [Firmicutes bacterium]|nr:hypothetical protein [Bacillota bacterium]
PSHHEIFGNAIFEGAMTKSNIVATNVLPLDEFGFSENAIPINPDDVDDIRSAIMKAYNRDIDEQFAEYVKQKYSLNAIFKEHIKVYNRI